MQTHNNEHSTVVHGASRYTLAVPGKKWGYLHTQPRYTACATGTADGSTTKTMPLNHGLQMLRKCRVGSGFTPRRSSRRRCTGRSRCRSGRTGTTYPGYGRRGGGRRGCLLAWNWIQYSFRVGEHSVDTFAGCASYRTGLLERREVDHRAAVDAKVEAYHDGGAHGSGRRRHLEAVYRDGLIAAVHVVGKDLCASGTKCSKGNKR